MKLRASASVMPSLPPLPERHRLRIDPQAFPRLSCFCLESFQYGIPRRILLIPPTSALFDEFLIEVRAIGQEYVSQGMLVLVVAVHLERDFLPEYHC